MEWTPVPGDAKAESFDSRGEADGEPYGVLAELASSGDVPGFSPLHLPETIDGAAIAALLLMADHASLIARVLYVVPLAAAAFGVTTVQGYITWRIASDLVPYDETCGEGDPLLRIICLGVFLMVMINDARDLCDISRWVQRLRLAPRHEMLRMQKFRAKAIEPEEREVYADGICVNEVVSGITRCEQFIAYGLVVPKGICLVGLTWFGSGYLVRSQDNESLIMNSLALTFVVEIGEYSYKFVNNSNMRYFLDGMPAVGLSPQQDKGWGFEEVWPILSFFVLGALIALVWHEWC